MATVTSSEHDTARPAADLSVLPPAAAEVVDTTDWAALRHVFGPAVDCPPHDGEQVADIPDLLRAFLHPDARTAARALDAVTRCAVDEGGDLAIFPFVPPVARFAAALLDDPRTLRRIPHPQGPPGADQAPRTALLALLADFAAEAAWHELHPGNPPHPPTPAQAEFLALRPALLQAVARHLNAPEPHARETAVLAAVMLGRHPTVNRDYLVSQVHGFLTEDDHRAYDTRGLIPEPVDWDAGGCTDDPPF
ncbi:hypothetical protein GCM10023205_83840 [Yinghuangia aomiensis]|uniref:Uncharacterized protein n=1 Tax=Yinghuangia aomiensis TaxID=676205 RepID=A0ABP9IHX0_9ACTN